MRAQFTTLSRLATTKPLSVISPVMPLITASWSAPGANNSRFQVSGSIVVLLMVLFPLKRALVPLVDKSDGQHGKEAEHRQEAEHADIAKHDSPGEQERHF